MSFVRWRHVILQKLIKINYDFTFTLTNLSNSATIALVDLYVHQVTD